jgi:hypothetical protein
MEVTAITNYFQPMENKNIPRNSENGKTRIQNQIQEKSWTSCNRGISAG